MQILQKGFELLPVAPGLCPECAAKHTSDEPHNKDSLFYQMRFYMRHNRYPTWADALSHCPKEIQTAWISELKKRGIYV